MGNIRIRAVMNGDYADIKCLMLHPEDTGLVKNKATGKLIPAHFITNVTATINGKTVLSAQWGIAISKNPFLAFRVNGAKAGDKLVISWVDNLGESASGTATIAAS
ncbi:MAG: thiosulfate oxidation carrier complex protein SoxZ [Betaproteobacteria bacterium]|nr:thiosulfate oxidation carrier complex protein SoxZ [Betaproteobacteria bacterium]